MLKISVPEDDSHLKLQLKYLRVLKIATCTHNMPYRKRCTFTTSKSRLNYTTSPALVMQQRCERASPLYFFSPLSRAATRNDVIICEERADDISGEGVCVDVDGLKGCKYGQI